MTSTLPSDEEILKKTDLLNALIDATLASKRKTNKVTVRDKLRLLNNELIRFKTSGVSFKVIRSLLAERVGLNVSEQTLREHCQQELGFKKRGEVVSTISTESDASHLTDKLSSNDNQFTQDSAQLPHSSKNQTISTSVSVSVPNSASTPAIEVTDSNSDVSNKIEQQTSELIDQLEDF